VSGLLVACPRTSCPLWVDCVAWPHAQTCPVPTLPSGSASSHAGRKQPLDTLFVKVSLRALTAAGYCDGPSGKSLRLIRSDSTLSQAFPREIFFFRFPEIHGCLLRIPSPLRGAYRDRHGRWTREAVDARMLSAACRADENIARGRAKSCGPDAPTLASSFSRDVREERWWLTSPVHQGDHV